jgi:exosortase
VNSVDNILPANALEDRWFDGQAGHNPAKLAVLSVLIVACYFPMLSMTGQVIVFGDEMAHGFFAPIVAAYVFWGKRTAVLRPTAPPSAYSLVALGFAAVLGVISTLAASSTFSRVAFLISLAGCVLLLGGWLALKKLRFPLALLLFTFPIPDVLYGQITQPLQLLVTRLSEATLELLGFSVVRDGNILQLAYMSLSVVEACSGLRSLITLTFFCLVYSYLFESKTWLRIAITLLAVPAAILANVLRISATGVLGKYNLEWTRGTYHEVIGWVGFFVGFLMVFLSHRCIRKFLRPPAATSRL